MLSLQESELIIHIYKPFKAFSKSNSYSNVLFIVVSQILPAYKDRRVAMSLLFLCASVSRPWFVIPAPREGYG